MEAIQQREITTISFGRACRDRIGMYLSGDSEEALRLAVWEILNNSLDAMTETGVGSSIMIEIDTPTRTISIKDDGPGIPMNQRPDKVNPVVAAYTMAHTGSHFKQQAVAAVGLNGVGGSIVNHTAQSFFVQNFPQDRKSPCIEIQWEGTPEGANQKYIKEIQRTDTHGVHVKWIPDEKVYGAAWISHDSFENTLRECLRFYPKITVNLRWNGYVPTKYHYPKGLKDKNTVMYYESDSLILALDTSGNGIRPYGNRLFLPDGGKFFTHFKTQLTRLVNTKTGLKLTGAQVQQVFGGIIAIFVPNPLFSNQSKTSLSNAEINPEISAALNQVFDEFSKTKEWSRIVSKLELELKAEQAAERARARVKNAMDTIRRESQNESPALIKFKDCIEHGQDSWLMICEGDSAQGALNLARDIRNIATIPVRGKVINCLRHPREEFLNNAEIQALISRYGAGIFEEYNSKKLRFGKGGIAVDADKDGFHILYLLVIAHVVLMPKFVQEGRLYWIRAPLYTKPDSYIFTEEEWAKVTNKKGYSRNKGLGEMDPEETAAALFGAQKRWERLVPTNWEKFVQDLTNLFGEDPEVRRKYLFDHVNFETITFL